MLDVGKLTFPDQPLGSVVISVKSTAHVSRLHGEDRGHRVFQIGYNPKLAGQEVRLEVTLVSWELPYTKSRCIKGIIGLCRW